MTDEEIELGAVPAAVSAGYGEAVTDDEFEAWVKRSQGDTDAILAEWDNSVGFEQVANATPPPMDDPDIVIEAEILNEDGTVWDGEQLGPGPTEEQRPHWQALAARIRAGVLGPEDRALVSEAMMGPRCDDPNCPVCGWRAQAIDGASVPEMPAWALEVAQRMIAGPPGRSLIMSMPLQRGRSNLADQMQQILEGTQLVDPFAEERARAGLVRAARSTLRQMGFAIVERDDYVTLRRSSMVRDVNRYGWFVSELAVMNAMADTQPAPALILPGEEQMRWARREFGVSTPGDGAGDVPTTPYAAAFTLRPPVDVPFAPQRQATFTGLTGV